MKSKLLGLALFALMAAAPSFGGTFFSFGFGVGPRYVARPYVAPYVAPYYAPYYARPYYRPNYRPYYRPYAYRPYAYRSHWRY